MFSQQSFCYARCSQARRRRNVSSKFFRRLFVVMSARVHQRRDKRFAPRTSDPRYVFDCFRQSRFSDSPDQVVWVNLRNERVATGVSARVRRALIYLRLLRLILPGSSRDCRDAAETDRQEFEATRSFPVSWEPTQLTLLDFLSGATRRTATNPNSDRVYLQKYSNKINALSV